MSVELARQVADTVLFEGYVLYPYRASAAKNQVRWQFGVLAPRGASPDEPWCSQTECLVEPDGAVQLGLTVRFLQVQRRDGPVPWDEGVVREINATAALDPDAAEQTVDFTVPGGEDTDSEGTHRRWPLSGRIRVRAELAGPYGLLRVRIRVENHTPGYEREAPRPALLPHALIATHVLLTVRGGAFLSLLDPPEWALAAAKACENEGTWPVLVGAGRHDVLLSSPIILYDYPELAPESPGDLYDATEIDEILTLRTMALTDEEKREARATDPRAAAIVDRVDAMPAEVLERLHGAVRYLRRVTAAEPEPVQWQQSTPWWDPGADRSVSPETDSVPVPGGLASRGSRVRLRPAARGSDAQDMFLRDRPATVQAVLFDVDGAKHLAVTLDDDPAAELQVSVGRYLYFAPDEVELLP